jgi:hypothetical protein
MRHYQAIRHCLAAAVCLLAASAAAQPSDPIRVLPAAAQKPPEVVAEERAAAQEIPPPPAKGRAAGRPLPSQAQAPADVSADQAAQPQLERVGPPPQRRAGVEALIERVRATPEGRARADAARQGIRPSPPQRTSPPDRPNSASLHLDRLIDRALAFLFPAALAGETLTIDLTPQVDQQGRRAGLHSANPYAYAIFRGAMIYASYPNNDLILIAATNIPSVNHQISSPHVQLVVQIPQDGWYIVNANAMAFANVSIRHYQGSAGYVEIASLPRQSGWADYPTLQYLASGNHYFYWLMGTAYVSRISVDSYP